MFTFTANVIKASVDILSKGKLKWLRSLGLEKYRRKEQSFIIYGEKIIGELLQEQPELLVFMSSTDEELCSRYDCVKMTEQEMKAVSGLRTEPNILAVVKYPEIKAEQSDLVLLLDGIQDPGNLGTIIRTADWFGVKKIICSENSVSAFNPKVLQSSMGSVFRVSVEYGDLTDVLLKEKRPVFGAVLDGNDMREIKTSLPAYLLIGSEGQGIRDSLRKLIDVPVFIPSFGKAESLNAAIACGILLAKFRT